MIVTSSGSHRTSDNAFWTVRAIVVALAVWSVSVPPDAPAHSEPAPPTRVTLDGLNTVYSTGSIVVGSASVVTDAPLSHGRLDVVGFDVDKCDNPEECGTPLFKRTYGVDLPTAGTMSFKFNVPPPPVAAYAITATLSIASDTHYDGTPQPGITLSRRKRTPLAFSVIVFGVRQPDLAAADENLLRADVMTLDVAAIESALKGAAASGQPVELTLAGVPLRIRVTSHVPIGPGVEIPGVADPIAYVGEVVSESGDPEPDSFVHFMVLNGQLNGRVTRRSTSAALHVPFDHLLIDPASEHIGNAPPAQHVMYHSRHARFPYGPHDEWDLPAPTETTQVSLRGGILSVPDALDMFWAATKRAADRLWSSLQPTEASAQARRPFYFAIPFYVAEHAETAADTNTRLTRVSEMMEQFVREFRNVALGTGVSLNVVNAFIGDWIAIPTTGYGGTCGADLNRFGPGPRTTPPGIPLLISRKYNDDGVGGCASAGSLGSALATDKFVAGTTQVMMQEVGHALDYHNGHIFSNQEETTFDWHDPHNSDRISEQNWFACTAMRAGYGVPPLSCWDSQAVYHWDRTAALEEIARGIYTKFAPSPYLTQVTGTAVAARDLAIGASRDVWMTASDGRIFKKSEKADQNPLTGGWGQASGGGSRIAVSPCGIPWVANFQGLVWRKQKPDAVDPWWDLILDSPSIRAVDIGVGGNDKKCSGTTTSCTANANCPSGICGDGYDSTTGLDGSVWILGGPVKADGNFAVFHWVGNGWIPVPNAGGIAIAVDATGAPWIATASGELQRKGSARPAVNDFVTIRTGGTFSTPLYPVVDVALGWAAKNTDCHAVDSAIAGTVAIAAYNFPSTAWPYPRYHIFTSQLRSNFNAFPGWSPAYPFGRYDTANWYDGGVYGLAVAPESSRPTLNRPIPWIVATSQRRVWSSQP